MARKTFASGLAGLTGGTKRPTGGEVLAQLPLEQILPDSRQPRRIVPDDLREDLLNGKKTAKQVLLEMWERCLDADLYDALRSLDMTPDRALAEQRADGRKLKNVALQITLEGLTGLAQSIDKQSLLQPIGVYETDDGYRIAQGERRWLAHVLLREFYLRVEAAEIKARVLPAPLDDIETLERQVAENAQRKDLSAIARSRAMQQIVDVIIAEAAQSEKPEEEDPPKGGRPRQIEGLIMAEVHELAGARMGQLTGDPVSGRQVRNYLSLLELPPEAQAVAEAALLGERALRPLTSLKSRRAQIQLVEDLASGRKTASQVAREAALAGKSKPKAQSPTHLKRLQTSLKFTAAKVPPADQLAEEILALPAKKKTQVVDQARQYVMFLQNVLAAVDMMADVIED